MEMYKGVLPEYKPFSDLPLIAVLHYFGIREEAVERKEGGKATFNFWVTKETDELIKKFYAGQLLVDPAAFALHLKSAKNQIYGQGL